MGTSLKDIAETLNLSKTTVSWVLSGRADEKGISAATQQRVSRCAQQLNYRPNLLARSLNTGESGMIGLILPSISDSFYSQVAREVEMEVEEHGYSLMICSSESEPERENRMIRLFRAKQVDGLIIAPTVRSGEEIRRLVDESFPFVVFDRRFPKLDTHCVLIDNERSSYALVRRLTEDGFRRIAVITTNPHLETMEARRAGYGRALADAGIAFVESLYGEVEFAGYERNLPGVLDRIFARDGGVDGFFFTTHILALAAFRYFHDRGVDINDGYGLACIHEVPFMSVLAPGMHVARMPVGRIGRESVRMLLEDMRRRKSAGEVPPAETVELECELCFRG